MDNDLNVNGWKVGFTSSAITVTTTLVSTLLVTNNLMAVFAAALATNLGNSLSDGISVGTSNEGDIDFASTGNDVLEITTSELAIGLPMVAAIGVMAYLQRRGKLEESPSLKFRLGFAASLLAYVGVFIALIGTFLVEESILQSLYRIGLIFGTIILVSFITFGIDWLVSKRSRPTRS